MIQRLINTLQSYQTNGDFARRSVSTKAESKTLNFYFEQKGVAPDS